MARAMLCTDEEPQLLSEEEAFQKEFNHSIGSDTVSQETENKNLPGSDIDMKFDNHVESFLQQELSDTTSEKHSPVSSVRTLSETFSSDEKDGDSEEDGLSPELLNVDMNTVNGTQHEPKETIPAHQDERYFESSESDTSDTSPLIKSDKKCELIIPNKTSSKTENMECVSAEAKSKKNNSDMTFDEILEAPVEMATENLNETVVSGKIQETSHDIDCGSITKNSLLGFNDKHNLLPEYFKFCETYPFAKHSKDAIEIFSKSSAPRATWTTTRYDFIKWINDQSTTDGGDEQNEKVQNCSSGTPKKPVMMLIKMVQPLQTLLCCKKSFMNCVHDSKTPKETKENNDETSLPPVKDEALLKSPPSLDNEEKFSTTSV